MMKIDPTFPSYDARIAAARQELVDLEQVFEENKKKPDSEDRMWGGVRIASGIRRINDKIKSLETQRDDQECFVEAMRVMMEKILVDKLKRTGYNFNFDDNF